MSDLSTPMRKVRIVGLHAFFSDDEVLDTIQAWITFEPMVQSGVVRLPSGELISSLRMTFPLVGEWVGYVVNPDLEGVTPNGFNYRFVVSAEGECGKAKIAEGILDFSEAPTYTDALGDTVVDLTPLLPSAQVIDDSTTVPGGPGTPGAPGRDGASAYQVWLRAGNVGTIDDYLNSLKGPQGEPGPMGTGIDFNGVLDSITALPDSDPQGSAYIVDGVLWVMGAEGEWVDAGEFNVAPGEDGQDGAPGASAYDLWLAQGNTGSVTDFLRSLKGEQGEPGLQGAPGVGIAGITQTSDTTFLVTLTDGSAESITMPTPDAAITRTIESIEAGDEVSSLVVTWTDGSEDTVILRTPQPTGDGAYDDTQIRAEIQGLSEALETISLTPGPQGEPGEPGRDGASAYDLWLNQGNTGDIQDYIASLKGEPGEPGPAGRDGRDAVDGEDGASAYEVWLSQGNAGTITDYLNSLKGEQGPAGEDGVDGRDGDSAYEVWLSQGNTGTIDDYIASLRGEQGPAGRDGRDGEDGASAYEIWLSQGNTGSVTDYLASLKGEPGPAGRDGRDAVDGEDGASAYEVWLSQGNTGSITDYLASLKGATGARGPAGRDGIDGSDGESAYEVWLSQGNTGSVADYLASLKGPKGDTGAKGDSITGPAGPAGKDGVSIDSVVQTSESTFRVGRSNGAQTTLTMPQGPQGPIGPKGDPGDPAKEGRAISSTLRKEASDGTLKLISLNTNARATVYDVAPGWGRTINSLSVYTGTTTLPTQLGVTTIAANKRRKIYKFIYEPSWFGGREFESPEYAKRANGRGIWDNGSTVYGLDVEIEFTSKAMHIWIIPAVAIPVTTATTGITFDIMWGSAIYYT